MVMNSTDIIIAEFDLKERSFRWLPIHDLKIDQSDESKIYWIHCILSDVSLEKVNEKLNLPADVVQLCKMQETLPKLIDDEDSLTLVVQVIKAIIVSDSQDLQINNLIIHLTKNYCFTASQYTLDSIEQFQTNFTKNLRYAKTPCFILFLILDEVVNDYSKTLFNFELLTETLDLEVHKEHKYIYDAVMDANQLVMRVKRYNVALREILMRITGRNIPVISRECRISLSKLAAHAHMVAHEADSIRDILSSLLAQLDNSLMQKLNESMRILTVFASILLPLTLIAGIYGMNFKWMPELEWKYGYLWALGLIIFVGLFLIYYFKKKKLF